jgi:hypothetical protein
MWLTVLYECTLTHNDDLVEVENSIESVRDGNDRMGRESLAEEPLDDKVRCLIETALVSACRIRTSLKGLNLLARGFVKNHDIALLLPQQRSREAEQLPLSVTQMQILDFDI